MEQLFEFIGNHPFLTLAFVAIVVAIIVTEVFRFKGGGSSVEPGEATNLYNRQNALFVDIRGDSEFRKAHLPGAVHVPGNALDDRLSKLKQHQKRPLIVYCSNGLQSGRVAARLRKEGFEQVSQLKGGIAAWQSAGFPLEGK